MRNALLYILVFATLLPTVSQWGAIAYYQVNKDYIARVLCENRDRPDLHCDGQCYLAKRLKAQQDKQDKETTERVQNTPVVQLFCDHHLSFLFQPSLTELLPSAHLAYEVPVYAAPATSFFHPPCV
ncbi:MULTISPECIES: hypothetical protein [unclassified Spirosoma]|uniref:hypothetical protein n=1 Tax=unclassified Spirosoma TaxID=2621999 RepID=UPI000963154B|nr:MULTISPECIES: hypothetical protein [unclassified Spirosoma]MBN8822231.1 hypothetical protein [Spirosoma sp.]OJW72704.1 MAG: hypothetical protein BGO59_15095 [Spirosoma sp. 48-14]